MRVGEGDGQMGACDGRERSGLEQGSESGKAVGGANSDDGVTDAEIELGVGCWDRLFTANHRDDRCSGLGAVLTVTDRRPDGRRGVGQSNPFDG